MRVWKDALSGQAISPEEGAMAAAIAVLDEGPPGVVYENYEIKRRGPAAVNDNPVPELALQYYIRVSGRLP